MNGFDYGVIADFLSENWMRFTRFAGAAGIDEEACEGLIKTLERMAGRS